MSDELLQAMCEAYWKAAPGITNSMRAILGVLHANGYRRCAEGQGVTQWCAAWEQADKACRDLTEKVIPNIRERAEKAEAERDALRAEVERLRGCRDELKEIGRAINDPRVHNTMTIAEWCEETQADLRRLKSGHCKDCCCARTWEALGISVYTGRSIVEEIELLRADAERYRWLRRRDVGPSQIWELLSDDRPASMTLKTESELDAAIDASRGES